MSLTKEELLHLAKLSRLQMSEETLHAFQPQLEGILNYVGRLQSVEVSPVSAESLPTEATVRQDIPLQSSEALLEELQSAFPDRVDHLLRVPGVFEKPKD